MSAVGSEHDIGVVYPSRKCADYVAQNRKRAAVLELADREFGYYFMRLTQLVLQVGKQAIYPELLKIAFAQQKIKQKRVAPFFRR